MTFIYPISPLDNYLPSDLTSPLKLNILSNHGKYLKGLAPFVIHATPFYNSKIFISNGSASLFREDDFSLREVGQSLETVGMHFKTIVKHLEALCSGFNLSG